MTDSHPPTNGTAPVLGAEIAQPDGELRNSASPKSSPKMMAAGDSHMEPDPMEGRPESPPKSSTQPAQPTHHGPSSTASTTLTKGQTTSSSPTAPTTPSPPQAYPQPTNQPGSHAGPSSHQPLPSPKLLSTHLIAHPSDSAGRAMKKVFPNPNPIYRLVRRFKVKHSVIDGLTPAEEKRWNAEGAALRRRAGWRLKDEPGEGVPVSELFWKVCLILFEAPGGTDSRRCISPSSRHCNEIPYPV